MLMRRRGGRPGIWAVILALYAMILHEPSMAAIQAAPGGGLVVAQAGGTHEHGGHANGTGKDSACCVVCSVASCSAAPPSETSLLLGRRRSPTRRGPSFRTPPLRTGSHDHFEARGPPRAA